MRRVTAIVLAASAALAALALGSNGLAAGGGEQADVSSGRVDVLRTARTGARPCPRVVTTTRFVSGGCRTSAYEFDARLSIRTLFGRMYFGSCVISADVTTARDGRLWFDEIRIGGTAPCNDLWACSPAEVLARSKNASDPPPLDKRLPWTGRLDATDRDGARGRVNVCLDTCAGRYKGPVDIDISRKDGGLAMRIRHSGVGSSALEIDGEWKLEPARLAFR